MPRTRETRQKIFGLSRFRGIRHEECGLLVPVGGDFLVIKVPNYALFPEDDFAIAKADMERLQQRGLEVVGFLHTHTDHHEATPSDKDYEGASLRPDMLHVVYKPSTRELHWF